MARSVQIYECAPLGLNREDAAAYIGVGISKFDEMVADNRMPAPHTIDRRRVWDREEVKMAFKELPKINEKDIVGSSRRRPIAEARQISVYLCREIMGTSLMDIGMHFGGRDHTTILHACRNIEKKIKTDKRIGYLIRSLQQDLTFSLI